MYLNFWIFRVVLLLPNGYFLFFQLYFNFSYFTQITINQKLYSLIYLFWFFSPRIGLTNCVFMFWILLGLTSTYFEATPLYRKISNFLGFHYHCSLELFRHRISLSHAVRCWLNDHAMAFSIGCQYLLSISMNRPWVSLQISLSPLCVLAGNSFWPLCHTLISCSPGIHNSSCPIHPHIIYSFY